MKRWSKLIMALLFFGTGFLYTEQAKAQCSVTLVSPAHDCSPATTTFQRTDKSGKKISSILWDFGDASTGSDSSNIVAHAYAAGSYKIKVTTTYADGSTCVATVTQTLKIYPPPVAKLNLPSVFPYGSTQCFKRDGKINNFAFTESSQPGPSGAPIKKYLWNFGDGNTSTSQSPNHSYQSSGTYTVTLAVTDTNGCSNIQSANLPIVVLKDIKTKFSYNSKLGCNSATITFKDITDTVGLHVKSWLWDFGDGTPTNSTDYNPVHIYGPGNFVVKLTITNNLGCTATDSQLVNVSKFEMKIFFKDTICWADAANNGVVFSAEQQPNVTFWQWNFGDPNSAQQNVANFAWTASHKFVGGPGGAPGGPGNYRVKFLMINANPKCGNKGQLDTCFIVHIKGPMAMVNLPAPPPFPLNNIYPATKMPKSDFTAIINAKSSCGPQTIKYSRFSRSAAPVKHVINHYCNADTISLKRDTATDCYGKHKMPLVSSITLKPTNTTTLTYYDSTETSYLWTKGIDPVPSGNVYYPSSGTFDWNDMHDSNLITCKLPNLVRFTNNSIKYRLQIQMDDNTFTNVLDPTHSFQDTCRWKNYPMSSDSLIYFWKFNDPTGKQCTSTTTNKDWNCNFSTLCAPYHYYKGPKLPNSRCQSVNMQVIDAVANCGDSTVFNLVQGPPNAYWDRTAYCKMTWEMQVTQLAPKGQPGPSGPPLIGFQFSNQANACTGPNYQFRIDFGQTLPTCGAEHWWATFDSAYTTKYLKCKVATDSVKDYGFLGDPKLGYTPGKNSYPAAAPDAFWNGLPWLGNYWYEVGDSGCKTIGIVLQNGKCYDTAWYHDYICFNKLEPYFNVFSVDSGWACGTTGNFKKDGVDSVSIAAIYAPNDLNHPKGHCGGQYAYYVNNQTFVDDSKFSGHGHICQKSAFAPVEGVRVRLFPENGNQRDVTAFKYNIQRRTFYTDPTNTNSAWYYNLPFWPDSATLTPFTTWNDTVRQIDYKVYYIDTPYLYIILNQPGLPPHRVLRNFPLYQREIDSLKATFTSSLASPKFGHVNVGLNDERARAISAVCGKPYVTVYASKIAIKGNSQVLNLKGFKAVDSLTLPYPGFYTIQTTATNLQGCVEPGKYQLIYGHFATFNTNNDSVVCLGTKINFSYYVRYWSTNCPPPPGGGLPPEGCLNGYDEDANGNIPITVDFAPWDSADPLAYRMAITGGKFKAPDNLIFKKEQMFWNFGDDAFFYKVPTGGKVYHTYIKPGVYTVSMKTIDWRGCAVTTVRKNLVKVIQPVADFQFQNPADSLNFCAPTYITFVDKTVLKGATYKQKVVKNGLIVDSTFRVDSIATHIWTPGDGRTITRTTDTTVQFVYKKNGVYTVGLTMQTDHGCSDTKSKLNYVHIVGPTPKFELIGKTSGCYPFTVNIKNYNTSNVNDNTWHLGDDTIRYPNKIDPNTKDETTTTQTQTTKPPKDSIVSIKYLAPRGHFRIYVHQGDTFHNNGVVLPECYTDWPSLDDTNQFWVRIWPNSPLVLTGDTLLCVDKKGTYSTKSSFGEYRTFTWDFGNGIKIPATRDDSILTFTYNLTDYQSAVSQGHVDNQGRALFTIKVTGLTDSGKCTKTATIVVHVEHSIANFTIDSSVKIATGAAKFSFHNKSLHATKFTWDFGDGTPQYTSTDSTEVVNHEYVKNPKMWDTLSEGMGKPVITYTVKLTTVSPNGCVDDTTKIITILREYQHYNVFTPNGDNINDKFDPGIQGATEYSMKIFNRWGQQVFSSNDEKVLWDGNDQGNGQPCAEGAYYYIWHFKIVGGIEKTIDGAVTLLRKK